jgi:hypothetical protein
MTNVNIGQVVRCAFPWDGNGAVKGKIGFVRHVFSSVLPMAMVQFFDNVGGHDGYPSAGKDGHCWNIPEKQLELLCEGRIVKDDGTPSAPLASGLPVYKSGEDVMLGDVVRYEPDGRYDSKELCGPSPYSLGMVKVIENPEIGIEFFFEGVLHDLAGHSEKGHGWWLSFREISLVHRINGLDKFVEFVARECPNNDDEA